MIFYPIRSLNNGLQVGVLNRQVGRGPDAACEVFLFGPQKSHTVLVGLKSNVFLVLCGPRYEPLLAKMDKEQLFVVIRISIAIEFLILPVSIYYFH